MIDQYYADPCASAGGATMYRINIGFTGLWQQSLDGGETWTDPTGDAEPPEPTEREDCMTDEECRCLAAANAANVLKLVYEEMIDAWNTDSSLDFGKAVFVTILGLLVGVWLGVIAAAMVAAQWAVFGGVWTTLEFLTNDVWTDEFNERLTCILYRNSTSVSGVVTFNYDGFMAEMQAGFLSVDVNQARLVLQLTYMMSFIGGDGLNVAGETTAIESFDCDVCEQQCDLSLGGHGQNSWIPDLPPTSSCVDGDLAYDSTLDRIVRTGQCLSTGAGRGYVVVGMRKTFDFDIDTISFNYDLVNSPPVSLATYARILDDEGTQVWVSDTNAIGTGTNRFISLVFETPLPAGEYYITLEAANGTTSVPSGAYAAFNAIQVCGAEA